MGQVIERQLGRVRWRVRWLTVSFGLGEVLVVGCGGVLGVVGLDYLLNLRALPRVVLLAAAGAAVVGTLVAKLGKPLMARLSLSDIAGRVEAAFPEFDDRLRSAVAFGEGGPAESGAMRARVLAEAEALAGRVDMRKAVPAKPAARAAGAGVGAVAVVVLIGAMVPGEYRSAAWARVSHPFGETSWPKRTLIELVGSLPGRVPAGERVAVRVRLAKGDKPSAKTTVYYQYDDGPVRSELMSRGADGTYGASLDARADLDSGGVERGTGLKVWVKAGDDEKHLEAVAVVPRLAVRKVTAHVVPPEYARGRTPESDRDLSEGGATIVEGSKVRLELEFNKPLAGVPELVKVGSEAAVVEGPKVTGSTASMGLEPGKTLRFMIAGKDADGFSTSSLTEYEIAVRADQPPAIQIELPRRNEDRTPNAVVPLEGLAEDDFGVKDVWLRVKRIGDGQAWEIPLVTGFEAGKDVGWTEANSSPERVRMRVRWLWELAKLKDANLKPGDVLEYSLAARDNYLKGTEVHEPATSSRLRITIVSQDEMAARFAQELRGVSDQVEQIKGRQHQTTVETGEFGDQTKGKPLDEASKGQVRRLGDQEATIASQTKQVSGKVADMMNRMAENRLESRELPATAKDVRDILDHAAEDPMKNAAADLSQARDAAAPERDPKVGDAVGQEKKAEASLDQASARLASLSSLRSAMASISKILAAQQEISKETKELGKNNLGKRPEEMSEKDRKKLEDLTKQQAELGKQSEKLLDDMDKQSEEQKKTDAESAEALKQASEAGKQQGVPGAQSKASSEIEQNKQQDAGDDQRRAEVGLQAMLEQLRAAERRKLEELSRKLADLQEQVAILIRRQAGHNLDNAGLRGAVGKMDAETLTRLLDESEREKGKESQGDQASLSGGQEQTERNTRGQIEAAGAIQGGGEIAESLTRAASRMERAAVLIRQSDLAGAYEPPQVDALSSLEQAKRSVDELKRKVDQQRQQQAQETIRQMYVLIRADEDQLQKDTARLDAIKARAGDELPRADQLALNALPGRQGALADRTAKIEESLIQLGSTVYVWANKDIVSTMGEVKDALGQKVTGKSTRGEQERIVEQLDAMIASLAVKPIEQEFEQKGGGGGGGKESKQKMPSEAELRLLKQFQLAVNKGTSKQASAAEPDKDVLAGLGRRQGQLREQLGDLLTKASNGQFKLGPEPDRKTKLPEETDAGIDDGSSLDQELLGGKPHGDADAKAGNVVDRMGRVRQRLAEGTDPGAVTQKLEDHVVRDLDALIEEARKQQAKSSSKSNSKSGNPANGGPKPGEQANNQGPPGTPQPAPGGDGAKSESTSAGGHGDGSSQGGDIKEARASWGAPTPRLRNAIVEGADDKPLEKYKALIDDYYRTLAEQNSK